METVKQSLARSLATIPLLTSVGSRSPLKTRDAQILVPLAHHSTLTVLRIREHFDLIPAMMTRTIAHLSEQNPPLITTDLNTHDKRVIDLSITPAGSRAIETDVRRRMDALLPMIELALAERGLNCLSTCSDFLALIQQVMLKSIG